MGDKKKTKVKVVVRVRPQLKETSKCCVVTNTECEKPTVEILNHRNIRENLLYDFSSVYDETCSQQYIYNNSIKNLLTKPLNGENISIFAYGPTGAGKTHTMLGSPTDPGMVPRVINGLFQLLTAEDKSLWKYTVTFSYLEIYNEKVQDLLEPASVDLPIREDGDHNIFVAGLAEKEVSSFDDFKNYFGPATNNRTVAATKLNDRSSRSHSIVMLKIKKSALTPPKREFHGKIYLIDLAGSEDNRRTGNQGIRLKESGAINKSLFVLGEVVDAINNNQPRIPYRNSKLTRLLQDSIGGSCHSLMITNIAPEEHYYYDTYCTLNFASKSKKIVNTNTTCIKQLQNSGGSTTSSGGENFLKRKNSSKLLAENAKKPRLAPSPLISDEAPVSTDPAPLLSPLMRRQNHLETTVNQRLHEMENNILQKISQSSQESQNPAMMEIQKQLMSFREELQKMREVKESEQEKPTQKVKKHEVKKEPKRASVKRKTVSPVVPSDENVKITKPMKKVTDTKKERKVLKDKTNEKIKQEEIKEDKKVKLQKEKNDQVKLLKMKEKLETVSCSPLFATVPRLFRKGFKSTACKKIFEDDEDEDSMVDFKEKKSAKKEEKISQCLNPELQEKHNAEFLRLLNTSSVKELQQLHTVGNKRARLMYDYRQLHGEFDSVNCLRNVPTLTEKYIKNLLHSNMVTV